MFYEVSITFFEGESAYKKFETKKDACKFIVDGFRRHYVIVGPTFYNIDNISDMTVYEIEKGSLAEKALLERGL